MPSIDPIPAGCMSRRLLPTRRLSGPRTVPSGGTPVAQVKHSGLSSSCNRCQARHDNLFRSHRSKDIMNLVIWLVVGGILGWIASMVMRTDAQQGIFLNIVVGIVGAALGGLVISPLVG